VTRINLVATSRPRVRGPMTTAALISGALIAVTFMAPLSPSAVRATSLGSWDLAADAINFVAGHRPSSAFRADGDPGVQWHLMRNAGATRDGTYSDLADTTYGNSTCGFLGFARWEQGGVSATVNTTDATINCGSQVLPSNAAFLHPSSSLDLAIVGWQAFATATYNVAGQFIDRDAGGGSGIKWFVDSGTSSVVSGTIANGGSATFDQTLTVADGDFLYFVVDANGDYGYDMTELQISISPVGGEPNFWNLARDLVANVTTVGSTIPHYDGIPTWYLKQSTDSNRDGGYQTLDTRRFDPNGCATNGVGAWVHLAGFMVNTTTTSFAGSPCATTQHLPPSAFVADPSDQSAELAVVGWKSPIAGNVSVSGAFTDRDAGGGNGVSWYVHKNGDASALASGKVNSTTSPPTDSGAFAISSLSVAVGDYLYFIVDRDGNGSWDLTQLDVTINELDPGVAVPPTIVAISFTPDGSNGWFKTSPAVGSISAADDIGVTDITCTNAIVSDKTGIGSTAASATVTVSSEGATSVSCTATDGSQTDTEGATVKIDTVAPSVTLDPAADSCSAVGDNGWCRGIQTAGFTASDATSGLAGASPFTKNTTTNGSAVVVPSATVCDLAGNCNSGVDAGPFKIDSAGPILSGTTFTLLNRGFVPADTFTSFPATAGAPIGGFSGNVTDATSGVQTVTANASAVVPGYTAGHPMWAHVPVTLAQGTNQFTFVATDQAGNTASNLAALTYDSDLDDDGIENSIDPHRNTPGTDFSDALTVCGACSATVGAMTVPAGRTVSVTDADSPAGVVAVVGGSGDAVVASLTGKLSDITLSGGTYLVTDPESSFSIATQSGGPATVTVTVQGAPHTISIALGGAATINEIVNEGILTGLEVAAADDSDAGAVTVDGQNVPPAGTTDFGDSCAAQPFSDVPTGHAFCKEIEWMRDANISTGFNDGTYRPSTNVTRQAMSAFMARLAGAALAACDTAPFPDVPTSHPFCKEIKWMKESGISTGFGDGTYRPGANVTRQAMSAFVARLAGATLAACDTAPFPDVPTSHPFCKEIKWMKESGISAGFGDGTYRPGANVTRQAMSAFMFRLALLGIRSDEVPPGY
jgi:hypothetical protein